jgi:hypothetical protein
MKREFPVTDKTKNLFLSLVESIASHVGGTNMGDHWPWEARELDPRLPFNENTFLNPWKSIWLLKTSIIGNYCISCPKGWFSTLIGD